MATNSSTWSYYISAGNMKRTWKDEDAIVSVTSPPSPPVDSGSVTSERAGIFKNCNIDLIGVWSGDKYTIFIDSQSCNGVYFLDGCKINDTQDSVITDSTTGIQHKGQRFVGIMTRGGQNIYEFKSVYSTKTGVFNTMFNHNPNLQNVALIHKSSDNDYSNLSLRLSIGKYMFYDCLKFQGFIVHGFDDESLKTINYTDKNRFKPVTQAYYDVEIDEIGDYAFANCTSLVSSSGYIISGPIGNYAFLGCSNWDAGDVKYKYEKYYSDYKYYGITVGTGSFAKTGTTVFKQGSELNSIPAELFQDCKQLSAIRGYIGENWTARQNIGARAFAGCSQLSSIDFEDGMIEAIEDSAFEGCRSLQEMYLPEGLKRIGKAAFKDCTALEYIYIPGSVEFIDSEAFAGCTRLLQIDFEETEEYDIYAENMFDEEKYQNLQNTYIEDSNSITQLQQAIADHRLELGACAFKDCGSSWPVEYTYSLALPSRLTVLGRGVFQNTALNMVYIDDIAKLQYMGHSAFADCGRLELVYLGGNFIPSLPLDNNKSITKSGTAILLHSDNSEIYAPNQCVIPRCAKLTTYVGPIEFLYGYNVKNKQTQAVIQETQWTSNNNLTNIYLTQPDLYGDGHDAKAIIMRSFENIFIPSTSTLTHIWFNNETIDSVQLNSLFMQPSNVTNNQDIYFPSLQAIVGFDGGMPNISQISQHPSNGNSLSYNAFKALIATSDKNNYFFLDDKVRIQTLAEYQSISSPTTNQYLAYHYYKKYVHLHANNEFDELFNLSYTNGIQYLFYRGDAISSIVNLPNLKYVYFSSDIKYFAADNFINCTQLRAIGEDYKPITQVTDQHTFTDLKVIAYNTFPLNNDLPIYARNNPGVGTAVAFANAPHVLLRYQYPNIASSNNVTLNTYSVFAKQALLFEDGSYPGILILPFIGNRQHSADEPKQVEMGEFSSLNGLSRSLKALNKLMITPTEANKTTSIILERDTNSGVFEGAELTHLIIDILLDVTYMNSLESNCLFAANSFVAQGGCLQLGGDTIYNSPHIMSLPDEFMGALVKDSERIVLLQLDCLKMSRSGQVIFPKNCFNRVRGVDLIMTLPAWFKVATDTGNTYRWFDLSQSHIWFTELYYPQSLENFVAIGNTFGSEYQVILPYVYQFYTKSDNEYITAPSLLSFSHNTSVTIPNNLLYNNKFLNSIDLTNVSAIEPDAFGLIGQMCLVELFNNSIPIEDLRGNTKTIWLGFGNDNQTTTSQLSTMTNGGDS